ncbi:metal ABC transporter solute-binding protein, Zn/Mn family [Leifsonia naganoensis]|uniref:Zinc/manganese transport system substrate-binding protein n=1 Tax=Leifsonia naganoensis TaxID=150025 RepID=A0A853DVE0_9MICO|nr:zinc ABC transporter substrate-binding protein [Leifsonia naganoensis]NYK09825.1 zinc/manganese transport system substrate-binding protein [Leifsonia naganoensis]
MQKRPLLAIALTAVAALALTGCSAASSGSSADDGKVRIVASTNVYGDIASTIAGDAVEVTSIMDDPAQDPHSFEASAQNQLAISKADIVIENGGGYDDFVGTMLTAAPNDKRTVLNVVDISGKKAVDGELNEHVWYDFPTVQKLADDLVTALSKADPAQASTFTANAKSFGEKLTALENRTAELKTTYAGEGVAITEPVPLYLLEAAGLENKTPEAFSEAIEEGTDVSPAVLQEMLGVIQGGSVKLLAYNEQTSGPETEKVLAAAKQAGVPVVPVTETLPSGKDYIGWMNANVDAVAKALGE